MRGANTLPMDVTHAFGLGGALSITNVENHESKHRQVQNRVPERWSLGSLGCETFIAN
jgi:hypothetical protein